VSPTLQASETSSADSVSGRPGSRVSAPAIVGVFVEELGPAVHFEGQVGDFHLWQEPFHLAAQGDQCDRLGVGIQRGEHDLVAASAVPIGP
jgi:hypothetical protein